MLRNAPLPLEVALDRFRDQWLTRASGSGNG
jgi:hypothetical protein